MNTQYDSLDIQDMVEELREASIYEGSEVGEGWTVLVDAYDKAHYISEEWYDATVEEIQRQYAYLIDNYTWNEEEVVTQTRIVRTLEYLG